MSGGMFDQLTDALAVRDFAGCDFGTALEIVRAAHEYDLRTPVPVDNVIRVDFAARRRIDDGQLA